MLLKIYHIKYVDYICFMKKLLFLFLLFFCLQIASQEKFSKEFSFINDNDLYVSFKRDRYYTNGMFFRFRHLTKPKSEKVIKRIFDWQIGHEMFTPNKPTVDDIDEHDRPFAGHLFGSFGINRVYKKQRIFNTSVILGVIGPNALGRELQELIHDIYGFKEPSGWDFQIKNAISANLKAEYIHHISTNDDKSFEISWINSGRIGTVYSDISSGFYMRAGTLPLSELTNSIAFNTNLNNESTDFVREVESFFFFEPTLRYAFYDATIQGSFLNEGSPVTKELIPLVFNLRIGFQFTANRFNLGYVFNYNTSKSEELRYTYGNKYGSIIISYLFH